MNAADYPPNWDDIAERIKAQANWTCEKCGQLCRQPGEQHETHRRTLTAAHINHVPMDCRDENLVALCSVCHLEYDNARRSMESLAKKRIARSQQARLF